MENGQRENKRLLCHEAARSAGGDMNGCVDSPGLTVCSIRRRREHVVIAEKKPVLNGSHLEA